MQDEGRYYTIEGQGNLPSVTTVLKLVAKPALIQWASNCAVDYILSNVGNGASYNYLCSLAKNAKYAYTKVSKEATDKGTEVHDAVEQYLKGNEPEPPSSLDVAQAFEAFKDWWESLNAEVLYVEEKIYSSLGYAGRLDILARIDGVVTLIDLKTSKSIYDDMGYQLAAYRVAWNNLYPDLEQIEAHGIIRVDKKSGEWEYFDFSSYFERDWKIFLNYLAIHQHLLERKEDYKNVLKLKKRDLRTTPKGAAKEILEQSVNTLDYNANKLGTEGFRQYAYEHVLNTMPTEKESEQVRTQLQKLVAKLRKDFKLNDSPFITKEEKE